MEAEKTQGDRERKRRGEGGREAEVWKQEKIEVT